MTREMVDRLGLYKELEGHGGCVNCIQWNPGGMFLASGSDDRTVIVWDAVEGKLLTKIETPHENNIFDVVWLPGTDNTMLGSCAGDKRVCVLNTETSSVVCSVVGHQGRVKRLAATADSPGLLWSGGEDGTVRQWDRREKWVGDSNSVLLHLPSHTGVRNHECKCFALCPGRSELLAVGSNDPYVRIFDRRMLSLHHFEHPPSPAISGKGVVQYLVPRHLPGTENSFQKKLRPLTATYLAYNEEGSELLVNLGGEQIYLYDRHALFEKQSLVLPPLLTVIQNCDRNLEETEEVRPKSNGHTNGHKLSAATPSLPPQAESLKLEANVKFENSDFQGAVATYSEALLTLPDTHEGRAVLFANRAAALMKRGWDGDMYGALRDCVLALNIKPDHIKAHLRLTRCLTSLRWLSEASSCLSVFKARHPEHSKSGAATQLEKELAAAQEKESNNSNKSATPIKVVRGASARGRYTAASFLRTEPAPQSPAWGGDSSDIEVDPPPPGETEAGDTEDAEADHDDETGGSSSSHPLPNPPPLGQEPRMQERELRKGATDYSSRFLGACNTTTDIKEANFLGRSGNFVMAGSDDGKFFIWDRKSGNIIKVLVGDESIVNCLQSHPTAPLLATSGIESVVRIWHPLPQEGDESVEERLVDDVHSVAQANQKRMNADPFETILLNLGYPTSGGQEDEEEAGSQEGMAQCRTS